MSAGALAATTSRLRQTRRTNLTRATEQILLGLCPILFSLFMLVFEYRQHAVATDFHLAYYPAVERMLHGGDLYTVTRAQLAAGTAYVYPPLAAIAFVPFALLGRSAGGLAFTLVCIACGLGTLRVMNVRDWRIYGIALLWMPFYSAWQTANLTLPLALLIALAWRHRDRPVVAGLLSALAITLKPFIWPLGLWLLATRRIQATAWTLAWGVAINAITWPVVGFDRISAFARGTAKDTDAMWRSGYGVIAAFHHLGYSRSTGEAALVIASACLVLLTVRAGLRGHERHALALAVVLMLVASPMVWMHYLALLMVPLVLSRPRFSRVWAVPLLMWVCPPVKHVHDWQFVVGWIGAACLIYVVLHDRRLDREVPEAASHISIRV